MIFRFAVILASVVLAVAGIGPSAASGQESASKPAFRGSVRDRLVERTLAPLRSSRPVIPGSEEELRRHVPRLVTASRPEWPSQRTFIERTMDRMDPASFAGFLDCCPCATAATCDDGLFCNGSEVCLNNACAPAFDPDVCNDADPCTTDGCVEGTDSCFNVLPPPPPDVARLEVFSAATPDVATLRWSSVPEAVGYNVYRASSAPLDDLACFEPSVIETSLDDADVPSAVFFYLVTAQATCNESSLGPANPGERDEPPVCLP